MTACKTSSTACLARPRRRLLTTMTQRPRLRRRQSRGALRQHPQLMPPPLLRRDATCPPLPGRAQPQLLVASPARRWGG